jgi:hypothetical protein
MKNPFLFSIEKRMNFTEIFITNTFQIFILDGSMVAKPAVRLGKIVA